MYLTGEIPFNDDPDTKDLQEEQAVGVSAMVVPILAGILSALRRVIARRVSLKVFKSILVQLHTALVFCVFFFGERLYFLLIKIPCHRYYGVESVD